MGEGGGGSEIQQPVQEKVDPVKEYTTNVVAQKWFDLLHFLGRTTDKKLAGTPLPSVNPQKVERSLHTRFERGKFHREIKSGKKGPADLAEMQRYQLDLDAFDRQFLNQGNIFINIPGLGKQVSRYTIIELPSKKEIAESRPPIFLVPALSGDLTGVTPLLREAALQGRKVISVGYPESFMGITTEAFAQASENSQNFEPYTTYFKKAIEAVLGDKGDFELWGYSTGGGLVTEILHDPKFQQRVANAVIIAPGGAVEQSKRSVKLGALHEVVHMIKRIGNFQDTAMGYNRKDSPIDKAHKELRDRIFNSSLFNKVGKKINDWVGMKVKEGGKIIVVTGREDEITKSYKVNQELLGLPNPQIDLLDVKKGSHVAPLIWAREVVGKIAEIRDNPSPPRHTTI